jgi:hypothetical protein
MCVMTMSMGNYPRASKYLDRFEIQLLCNTLYILRASHRQFEISLYLSYFARERILYIRFARTD